MIPLVDTYRFNDLSKKIKNIEHTPIVCATSRLVEQKGYDIAAQAITNLFNRFGALKTSKCRYSFWAAPATANISNI